MKKTSTGWIKCLLLHNWWWFVAKKVRQRRFIFKMRQFWEVFSPLHPLEVLTIPNSVWNAYQSSFWMQQGRIDPSGRNFFHLFSLFLAVDRSNPLLAQFHLPGGGPVVIFQHYLISHFQPVFLHSVMPLWAFPKQFLEKFEFLHVNGKNSHFWLIWPTLRHLRPPGPSPRA